MMLFVQSTGFGGRKNWKIFVTHLRLTYPTLTYPCLSVHYDLSPSACLQKMGRSMTLIPHESPVQVWLSIGIRRSDTFLEGLSMKYFQNLLTVLASVLEKLHEVSGRLTAHHDGLMWRQLQAKRCRVVGFRVSLAPSTENAWNVPTFLSKYFCCISRFSHTQLASSPVVSWTCWDSPAEVGADMFAASPSIRATLEGKKHYKMIDRPTS